MGVGNFGFTGYRPARNAASDRLSPMASMRTRISPGPGAPTSRSSMRSTSGAPCSWIRTTLLIATSRVLAVLSGRGENHVACEGNKARFSARAHRMRGQPGLDLGQRKALLFVLRIRVAHEVFGRFAQAWKAQVLNQIRAHQPRGADFRVLLE